MFKLEIGKKYVCRNGQVRELMAVPDRASGCIVYHDNGSSWWFSLAEVLPVHKVCTVKEYEWDIVAEYVEKNPRKASSPYNKLLTAKDGDLFVLKGEVFYVNVFGPGRIYLTAKDRKRDHLYGYIHVRNKEECAVFQREILIDLLRSGKYIVD